MPDWVDDIREAIYNIRTDIGAATECEFLADGKTLRAVTKGIADIGEAANQIMQVTPGLAQANPDSWAHLKRVYAMRNVLSHGYFRTDASVVWDTVNNHLPKLEKLLDGILLEADGGNNVSDSGPVLCP